MDKLIEAVHEKSMWTDEGDEVLYKADVIALVREAFEGHTLVPDGFLMIADCPNSECSDGVIARQVGDSEWVPEQCQWCHERSAMLAASAGGDNE